MIYSQVFTFHKFNDVNKRRKLSFKFKASHLNEFSNHLKMLDSLKVKKI